ncbi:MAG: aldehyde reductase [Leptospira sp.]|nr:aldehyde reductase [Leptospira sp.]NCS92422.1 aldehyde reductase [Leptospira sp.]
MNSKENSLPILVTGASGYVASWIVKYLLEEGYKVHGTVRSVKSEDKIGHLLEFQKSFPNKLELFEADLLENGSFQKAMKGCGTVIHTASPFVVTGIKDAQKELIDPALKGTRNVLETVNSTNTVKKVVLTSSVAAITGDGADAEQSKNRTLDETFWNNTSSLDHQPYSYSKLLAENEAWKIQNDQDRWNLVTINPSFILGPSLSNRMDGTSVQFVRRLISGELRFGVPKLYFGIVDVRDVAKAHLLAFQNSQAAGRYLTSCETKSMLELSQLISKSFGKTYPTANSELPNFLMYGLGPLLGLTWKFLERNLGQTYFMDHTKSLGLGLTYHDIAMTLKDHIEQMQIAKLI